MWPSLGCYGALFAIDLLSYKWHVTFHSLQFHLYGLRLVYGQFDCNLEHLCNGPDIILSNEASRFLITFLCKKLPISLSFVISTIMTRGKKLFALYVVSKSALVM